MADAHFVLSQYHRNFSGEERATRDPGLLGEMIVELQATHARVATLTADLPRTAVQAAGADVSWLAAHVNALTGELAAILRAQDSGAIDVQAAALAELANSQFDRHTRHFDQRPRVSRRPGLLADMVANLAQTLTRMQRLHTQEAYLVDNAQNMQIVQRHLAVWREELEKLTALRDRSTPRVLLDGFVTAVDAELQLYNGQIAGTEHSARDLAVLGTICDCIGELARQMAPLCDDGAPPEEQAALQKVRDARTMLSRAWADLLAVSAADAAPAVG